MVQLKSLALTLAACLLLGAQAGPCNSGPCEVKSFVRESNFEGEDPQAWQFDDGVRKRPNAPGGILAHNGRQYVYIRMLEPITYSMTQQLSGLKPNQPYTLTYFYALNVGSGVSDDGIETITYLDDKQVDYNHFHSMDVEVWTEQTKTIRPTSENPVLRISVNGVGNFFPGAIVSLDDVTITTRCGSTRV